MRASFRVLIVDDDEVDRLALERYLQRAEMSVTWQIDAVDSIESAIACLQAQQTDIVLLDYYLQGETAIDAIVRFRQERIAVPVVVLTGRGDQALAVEVMKSGAADYLIKDMLSSERLAVTINNVVTAWMQKQATERSQRTMALLTAVTASTTHDDFLRALVEHIGPSLAARWACIILLKEDGPRADIHTAWSSDHRELTGDCDVQQAALARILSSEDPVLLDAGPLSLAGLDLEAWCAGIALRGQKGKVVGLLALALEQRPDAESLQHVLRIFGERASCELQRLGMQRDLEHARRWQNLLATSAQELLLDIIPRRTVTTVLGQIAKSWESPRTSLWIHRGSTSLSKDGELVLRAHYPKRANDLPEQHRLSRFPRVWLQKLLQWQPVVADSALLDAELAASLGMLPETRYILVPLQDQGHTIGLLRLAYPHPGRPEVQRLAILQNVADLLAVYLQRQLQAELSVGGDH